MSEGECCRFLFQPSLSQIEAHLIQRFADCNSNTDCNIINRLQVEVLRACTALVSVNSEVHSVGEREE